ncbi:MAG: hypothetical protein OQK76_01355 [Gammaproteobacteria bacterium]|nr:hypothetical protein [Gammaproteobacteria bacterium]MCW8909242.1 hypothetical protein [Gammaproteobacteria bacterium]MCW9003824.1 hypothetical protein [Gammaproteobacteria bacterium]MCW9057152.1 hypothetical protein [Gammaproteobacteria bacterium]
MALVALIKNIRKRPGSKTQLTNLASFLTDINTGQQMLCHHCLTLCHLDWSNSGMDDCMDLCPAGMQEVE